jgi:4-hydroxy-tetrahydrodipicolinate reductase
MRSLSLHSLGVIGASGRLGTQLVALAREHRIALPVLASRRTGWTIEARPDVVVDVSDRSALPEVISYCQREAVPLVCATSNLDSDADRALAMLAKCVAVVRAENLSFGHHLQTQALAAIARCLAGRPEVVDVRIVDRHPAHKHDRPSATARRLSALLQCYGGAAVVESLRHGLAVSDHHIGWTFDGEEVIIDHRVTDRSAAATGALAAAAWIVGRRPGLSNMTDVYQQDP